MAHVIPLVLCPGLLDHLGDQVVFLDGRVEDLRQRGDRLDVYRSASRIFDHPGDLEEQILARGVHVGEVFRLLRLHIRLAIALRGQLIV